MWIYRRDIGLKGIGGMVYRVEQERLEEREVGV